MKKNFILISSLALFATVASASSFKSDVPQLPAQVVQAPRYTPAEKAIEASLADLRASARNLPTISIQPLLPQQEIVRKGEPKLVPVADASLTLRIAVKA
jgi:hypothetical protein